MKTRPSKTKILISEFTPINHSIIYHYQRSQKSFFVVQKSLRVLKLLRVFTDNVVFKFHIDRLLFTLLILSFIGFSLGSSGIGSSSGSAVRVFLTCRYYFFIKLCYYFFFIKNRCFLLHYIPEKGFPRNN